jgi:hypothetical protein
MKPMMEASGTKCLNLKHDELVSSFAFDFYLRRYTEAKNTYGTGCFMLLNTVGR